MADAVVGPIRASRILAGTLMAALVVIGIVLSVVVGGPRSDREGHPVHTHAPGLWMYFVILGYGVVAAALIQAIGYRIQPLDPATDRASVRETALRLYQQSMILRFAISESVAIMSIALLFSGDSNTVLPYVVAAVIAELLMAYHVWPSENLIARVQERLDRDGARSDLTGIMNGTV